MLVVAGEKSTSYSINTAFVGISRRAESVDRRTLVETFVDLGPLIPVLSSRDHQIVYGRRGTGKTHSLLYVTEQLLRNAQTVPVYVDLRNMGSSGGIYSDTQIPLTQRATRLLLDVLGTVREGLIEHAVNADLDLAVLGPPELLRRSPGSRKSNAGRLPGREHIRSGGGGPVIHAFSSRGDACVNR
jgi:hypothetical protein